MPTSAGLNSDKATPFLIYPVIPPIASCLALVGDLTESVSSFETLAASISYEHKKNLPLPTSHPTVVLLLKAIRRRYGRNCNYVEPLTEEIIRQMIDLLLSAKHGCEGALAPLSLWHSVGSSVLEFNTLSRFSDAIQLRVTDLAFPSQPAPHLSISFSKSKNDRCSEGS
jgi:hypothetical protein